MEYQYTDEPRPEILRMIPPDGHVIGSVGCGWAATEWVLAKQGRTLHGVDVSAEAIAVASTRLATARVVDPATSSYFPDESLDGLILADALEHIPQAWTALANLAKAVKPGGWVVISVPNMQSLGVCVQLGLLGDWPEKEIGLFDKTHIQMTTRRRLLRWCDGAGIELVRWFDKYDHPPRGRAMEIADKITLGLFHDWLAYQWQGVFRKRQPLSTAKS